MRVVILPKFFQFPLQVAAVPEECMVKIFTANGPVSRSMKGCDNGAQGTDLISNSPMTGQEPVRPFLWPFGFTIIT